jgi:hypothetical protein
MSSKVGCLDPSTMVDRVWLGGWVVDWICAKVWGRPSSGWRRWLCHLGGMIGVVFGLNPWLSPNVGIK